MEEKLIESESLRCSSQKRVTALYTKSVIHFDFSPCSYLYLSVTVVLIFFPEDVQWKLHTARNNSNVNFLFSSLQQALDSSKDPKSAINYRLSACPNSNFSVTPGLIPSPKVSFKHFTHFGLNSK